MIDVLVHLVHKRPSSWPDAATDCWCKLISRFEAYQRAHLKMCTEALQFCLDHPQLPVAPAAAASFYTVHAAALQDRDAFFGVFAFFQWDKGLELRRRLVDAFSQGTWPARWFVMAAKEPWLLRKLAQRMMRQWNGREFLERALQELATCAPSEESLVNTLKEVIRTPHYTEDWD